MPLAPPPDEPQWPPRSPREVLLSTSAGRERLRRMAERTSPSPSPLRNNRGASALSCRNGNIQADGAEDMDDEEEEDEETLQLKLQEIQARLRLKRLQKDKSKKGDGGLPRPESAPLTNARRTGGKSPVSERTQDARPASQATVIPVSPVRKVQAAAPQTSPSRVLLGIDKGLKAKDVSLRRAPSLRRNHDTQSNQGGGGYLQRSKTPNPNSSQSSFEGHRPLSFNERLAAARTEEDERTERQERIRKMRTNAFGISQEEMNQFKTTAVDIPSETLRPPEFSREQVLAGAPQAQSGGGLQRSNTAPTIRQGPTPTPTPAAGLSNSDLSENQPPGDSDTDAASFESYSSFHLSRRILPHPTLARQVRGKKILGIKDLLRIVKAPNYELPDVEQDVVVFAIVASKSEPRAHKPSARPNAQHDPNRTKYMVLTVVDLKWEMELFLFNGGFTRFWKITEGTVVAILNPNIMPPPPARIHSGKFSMMINSDEDTIIEVGMARDLGFCKSMKKNGQLCSSWVNKRRTEFCEFHSNEIIRKSRGARIELNQTGFGGEWKPRSNAREVHEKKPTNQAYDRETHSHWFATKSTSAAELIDGGMQERRERQDAIKRRLIAKEKEHEIMKTLGKVGNGAGRDYMRLAESKSKSLNSSMSSGFGTQSDGPSLPQPPDARSLGLLAPKGSEPAISLSPVKRKRAAASQASSLKSTTSSSAGLGWGGGLTNKLSRMKEGEKLVKENERQTSPVRKKTRFVTEKGIREAGRESLGEELTRRVELDDDDELVIVR